MHRLDCEYNRNQQYKIAEHANSGILIAKPFIHVPRLESASPVLYRCANTRLDQFYQSLTSLPKLFIAFNKEERVIIPNVWFLDQLSLKFCPSAFMVAGPDFVGCKEETIHAGSIDLFTQRNLPLFPPNMPMAVTGLFLGDGKSSRFIVETIEPMRV